MKRYIQKSTWYFFFVAGLILFASCSGRKNAKTSEEPTTELMVFAAASLTDVLTELVDSFESKYNAVITSNMASSGTLARQIEQGGTPDIFISANMKWADYVDSLDFVIQPYKEVIAKNDLVLIVPADSPLGETKIDSSLDILAILGENRLSMGDPQHVPAGQYAEESLKYFGWYELLDNKILPAKDVRSALMVVELRESPLGIVYRTDAQKSEKVKIIGTFPEESHKPIVYVSELCHDTDLGKAFFTYLKSDNAAIIWKKYGFN